MTVLRFTDPPPAEISVEEWPRMMYRPCHGGTATGRVCRRTSGWTLVNKDDPPWFCHDHQAQKRHYAAG